MASIFEGSSSVGELHGREPGFFSVALEMGQQQAS